MVAGPVVIGNPPPEWLTWLGGTQQEGGRESNYQSEIGSKTPVIIIVVELLDTELEGTLEKQRAPRFSPVLWQAEGPTTRSGSPGVAEGEHPQQGGELQAELSGKDKKLTEKWERKQGLFFLEGKSHNSIIK